MNVPLLVSSQPNAGQFAVQFDKEAFMNALYAYLSDVGRTLEDPEAEVPHWSSSVIVTIGDDPGILTDAVIKGYTAQNWRVNRVVMSIIHPDEPDLSVFVLVESERGAQWSANRRVVIEQPYEAKRLYDGAIYTRGHFLDLPIERQIAQFLQA